MIACLIRPFDYCRLPTLDKYSKVFYYIKLCSTRPMYKIHPDIVRIGIMAKSERVNASSQSRILDSVPFRVLSQFTGSHGSFGPQGPWLLASGEPGFSDVYHLLLQGAGSEAAHLRWNLCLWPLQARLQMGRAKRAAVLSETLPPKAENQTTKWRTWYRNSEIIFQPMTVMVIGICS